MCIGIAVLGFVLANCIMMIKDVDPIVLIAFMGGMVLIVAALVALVYISKGLKAKDMASLVLPIAALAIMALGFGYSISMAKGVDWKLALAMFGGIAVALLAAAVAFPILGKMNIK